VECERVLTQVRHILSTGRYDAAMQADDVLRGYLAYAPTKRDKGMALEALGEVLKQQGRIGESIETFEDADHYLTEETDRIAWAVGFAATVVAGGVKSLAPRVTGALQSLTGASSESARGLLPWVYVSLARVAELTGNKDWRLETAIEAVRLAEITGQAKAEAYSALSDAKENCGDVDGAIDTLELAMQYMQSGHCLMDARARHGALCLKLRDAKSAARSLAMAVRYSDLRDRCVLVKVLNVLADLGSYDPVAAVECTRELAARLNSSIKSGDPPQ